MSNKKKIIIAEDSNVIRNLINKILTQIGFETATAKNGKKVIKLMEDSGYDLILLDLYMPVMDGIQCAKLVRNMEFPKKNIPIIAISGNINNYTKEHFVKLGINEFIPKPINYDEIVRLVKRYTHAN